jgi:hypothetical protein
MKVVIAAVNYLTIEKEADVTIMPRLTCSDDIGNV